MKASVAQLLRGLLQRVHLLRPREHQWLLSLADACYVSGDHKGTIQNALLGEALATTWFDVRAKSILDNRCVSMLVASSLSLKGSSVTVIGCDVDSTDTSCSTVSAS